MPPRILVVDDDPHIRDVICFALERAGMVTDHAADGAVALRQFRATGPDLVVLDVGMPELDGLEVCRELRKTSTVPILFLSARDDEIDRISVSKWAAMIMSPNRSARASWWRGSR